MTARVTNKAFHDARDEAAILMGFCRIPHASDPTQQSALTSMERWRAMTDWIADNGGKVIIGSSESSQMAEAENPCLKETLDEIQRLALLEADWNDEGAPEIDRDTILRAMKFAQWLACAAAEQQLAGDCAPAVFPTIDGGVRLYWRARERHVALTFHPGRKRIDVMEKASGGPATHRETTENEAGAVAIEAMCDVG